MKPVCSFLVKFASLISWMISCFDRVIFKGHLPISRSFELENFVDYVLKMRRADFMEKIAPQWSERLVQYAKGLARNAGRPYEYFQGDIDKDAWAKKHLQASPLAQGLVGILCVMEPCGTFKIAYGQDRPGFAFRRVPQRVLYITFSTATWA